MRKGNGMGGLTVNKPQPPRRSSYPQSDIHEIARPATVIGLPTRAAFPTTCELLAKMALEHATGGEQALARRAAEDALLMIESLSDGRRQSDRAMAANAALTTGNALLLLHEAHRAKTCFEIATRFFDGERDLARAAEARVGIAKALLALHDPAARAVLEDAGELFEDIGDQRAARAIDFALRQAEADFEESPRSFHASHSMRAVSHGAER